MGWRVRRVLGCNPLGFRYATEIDVVDSANSSFRARALDRDSFSPMVLGHSNFMRACQ